MDDKNEESMVKQIDAIAARIAESEAIRYFDAMGTYEQILEPISEITKIAKHAFACGNVSVVEHAIVKLMPFSAAYSWSGHRSALYSIAHLIEETGIGATMEMLERALKKLGSGSIHVSAEMYYAEHYLIETNPSFRLAIAIINKNQALIPNAMRLVEGREDGFGKTFMHACKRRAAKLSADEKCRTAQAVKTIENQVGGRAFVSTGPDGRKVITPIPQGKGQQTPDAGKCPQKGKIG